MENSTTHDEESTTEGTSEPKSNLVRESQAGQWRESELHGLEQDMRTKLKELQDKESSRGDLDDIKEVENEDDIIEDENVRLLEKERQSLRAKQGAGYKTSVTNIDEPMSGSRQHAMSQP
eukprot:UN12327